MQMQFTYHPFGDRALLLQWEQRIDPALNAAVVRLSQAIEKAKVKGVQYCLPAYCSLTIGFSPEQLSYEELSDTIQSLADELLPLEKGIETLRQITIPVCYDGDFAPDLQWMSQHAGLSVEQIIQLHTATPFRVYMLGFLPGFPYLGILPKVLHAPRKESPRLRIPPGSVALAGLQTGIYPIESPGGWQLIGRTPWKVFDPERAEPFLLRAGDEVRFEAIGMEKFYLMLK